jgi:hypothetical protein
VCGSLARPNFGDALEDVVEDPQNVHAAAREPPSDIPPHCREEAL